MVKELLEFHDNYIRVRNATKKGYMDAFEGDCIDLSYPESKTRRGRVQKGICHTITCSPELYVVTKRHKPNEREE